MDGRMGGRLAMGGWLKGSQNRWMDEWVGGWVECWPWEGG